MTKAEAVELIDERMCFGRGKWSEHHTPEIDIYWQAGEMAIKALEAEPKWIPCSERLPEESGLYIVTNVGRWVEPVGTRYYNIRADGGFWSGHPGDKVLAWMPLPKPYEEDNG